MSRLPGMPAVMQPRRPEDFDLLYEGTPPWETGRPQPALLALADLGEQFDTVLDSGLFHVLEDDDRSAFVAGLRAVVPPGGRYFLLCFSDRQPGVFGARRITQDEIRAAFADGWRVDSIEPALIDSAVQRGAARAWLAAITRT
jgi:hypothetical protein